MENNSINMEAKNDNCEIALKKPKRILHFSDGTMEEYSEEDEQEEIKPEPVQDLVDASTLSWGPWFMHQALRSGSATLAVCDYLGETLASFLGITTPKYQYEIDEFNRLEKERQENENNSRGWLNSSTNTDDEGNHVFRNNNSSLTEQPTTTNQNLNSV